MFGSGKARLALGALCTILWSGVVTRARAADYPKDRSARAMVKKAIDEVYLQTEFEEAERILLGTIEACEYKCRPSTLARAYMYTGIVRGSGLLDQDGAFEAFAGALKLDPAVELDAVLATQETLATWERAVASRPRAKPEPKSELPPAVPSDDRELCPPGLPGCASEGDRCEDPAECKTGLVCTKLTGARFDTCNEPAPPTPDSRPHPDNWLGLHGAFDVAFLPAARGVCTAEANAAGDYPCFAGDRPYARDPSSTGPGTSVRGGWARATTRVLLSFDRSFGRHWLAGLRTGYAFGGSERDFVPFHAELRGRYLFVEGWLQPYASLGAGVAQVDTRLPLEVRESSDDTERTAVEAHAAFGRFFGASGVGVLLAPRDDVRLDLSLSVAALFPSFGIAVQPSAGATVGL